MAKKSTEKSLSGIGAARKAAAMRARFWIGQRGFWLLPPLAALGGGLSAVAFFGLADRGRLLAWFGLPLAQRSGSAASLGAAAIMWMALAGGLVLLGLGGALLALLRGQRATPEKKALEAQIQAMGAPARAQREAEALRAALGPKEDSDSRPRGARRL